jgi:hypothetical protein
MKLDTEKTEIALNVATTQISELIVSLESQVSEIEEKHKGVIPDASTREGYETCKAIRKEVMPTKTALEKARVTLKDPITKAGKFVDQSFNPLIERALAVYKPFVDAYQAVDKEKQRLEDERLSKVTDGLYYISNIGMSCIGKSSIVIAATIEEFEDYEIDSKVFRDKTDEATEAFQKSMGIMSDMLAQAVRQEEMDAKEAEMLAQQAARESEWQEQQAARQAEMDAKEAEMLAKEEAWDKKIQAQNAAIEKRDYDEKVRNGLGVGAIDSILTTEQRLVGKKEQQSIDISNANLLTTEEVECLTEANTLVEWPSFLREENVKIAAELPKEQQGIWIKLAVFSHSVGLSLSQSELLETIIKPYLK